MCLPPRTVIWEGQLDSLILFTLVIKLPSDNIPGEFHTIRDMLTEDVI